MKSNFMMGKMAMKEEDKEGFCEINLKSVIKVH